MWNNFSADPFSDLHNYTSEAYFAASTNLPFLQFRCGGNMGIFLQIRKCFILYMFNEKGSYFPAPYLDKFGETDPTLRRSLQLYLHQKRYDAVTRGAWLSHSVPSFVARRLEGDINHGGWETH